MPTERRLYLRSVDRLKGLADTRLLKRFTTVRPVPDAVNTSRRYAWKLGVSECPGAREGEATRIGSRGPGCGSRGWAVSGRARISAGRWDRRGPGCGHGSGTAEWAAAREDLIEESAIQVDLTNETVRLPLYPRSSAVLMEQAAKAIAAFHLAVR